MPDRTSPSPEGAVIPLSRWRALLARAGRAGRLDALLAEPDASRLVAALPPAELYHAIREVGLEEATELLALATPAQVRALVDLDVWSRDELQVERALDWLLAVAEPGDLQRFARVLGALDVELVPLLVSRVAEVLDVSDGEPPPDDLEGHLFATPDRFFLVRFVAEDEDEALKCERLLEWIYRADLDLGRRVLLAVRWDLPSDLEESCYRFRTGRLADLGYADFHEALEIYRTLDPASVAIGEGTAEPPPRPASAPDEVAPATLLPARYAEGLSRDSFFAQAMARLEAAELAAIQPALLGLLNRVLAAERVDAADAGAVRRALALGEGFLSIGLELLARGDAARGAEALRTVALVRLFRCGVSLAQKLSRLVAALARGGRVRGPAPGRAPLLEEPYAELAAALGSPRPELPRAFDAPPGPGRRPFASLADLGRAARAVEEMAAWGVVVVDGLGLEAPGEATFGLRLRTAVARALVGGGLDAAPLGRAELDALVAPGGPLEAGRLRGGARVAVEAAVRDRLAARRVAAPATLGAILDATLGALEEELGRVRTPVDPRLLSALLATRE